MSRFRNTHYSRRSLGNYQDFIRFSYGFHLLYVRSIPVIDTCSLRQERVCNVHTPIKARVKNGKKRVKQSVERVDTVRPTGNLLVRQERTI